MSSHNLNAMLNIDTSTGDITVLQDTPFDTYLGGGVSFYVEAKAQHGRPGGYLELRLVVCGREVLSQAPEYAGTSPIRRYIIEETRAPDVVTQAE